MNISKIIKEAHQNAKDHGWWDEPKSFGEIIALIHSEASEALEEHRNGRLPTETYYSHTEKSSHDIVVDMHDMETKDDIHIPASQSIQINSCQNDFVTKKPEGIPAELADIVIRVMDYCGYAGIDLEKAIAEKMEYNKSRPFKHGGKKL